MMAESGLVEFGQPRRPRSAERHRQFAGIRQLEGVAEVVRLVRRLEHRRQQCVRAGEQQVTDEGEQQDRTHR